MMDLQRRSEALSGSIEEPRCTLDHYPDLSSCPRHSSLTADEAAAAQALYDDPDIEVGSEGIGGFYAGQAEETIAVLKRAGFLVTRRR